MTLRTATFPVWIDETETTITVGGEVSPAEFAEPDCPAVDAAATVQWFEHDGARRDSEEAWAYLSRLCGESVADLMAQAEDALLAAEADARDEGLRAGMERAYEAEAAHCARFGLDFGDNADRGDLL